MYNPYNGNNSDLSLELGDIEEYEVEVGSTLTKVTYDRRSKVTTYHFGGPCGPASYDENGEEC